MRNVLNPKPIRNNRDLLNYIRELETAIINHDQTIYRFNSAKPSIDHPIGNQLLVWDAEINMLRNSLWQLPNGDGNVGNVLYTDGSGNLNWVDPSIASVASLTENYIPYFDGERLSNSSVTYDGSGDIGISSAVDISTADPTAVALEIQGTQLMRFKYGPKAFDVVGAPILLRYSDTKNLATAIASGSYLITFNARDNANALLQETWFFSIGSRYYSNYGYISQRISGTSCVRCFLNTNTTTAFKIEWELSDDGSGFDDSIEITVMEIAAGHGGEHRGEWETDIYANRSGGTELTRGGNGKATFGSVEDHYLMGDTGVHTVSPDGGLDVVDEYILIGADDGANSRTDSANKLAGLYTPIYYTSSYEPMAMLAADCKASATVLMVGGDGNSVPSPTKIEFYSQPVVASSTPYLRGYIDYTGTLVWGNPTGGGAKGPGAINAENIYDDNVLLTGYVFDKYYNNKNYAVEKWDCKTQKKAHITARSFENRSEVSFDMNKYEAFISKNLTLPVFDNVEKSGENPSIGTLINKLWEQEEVTALHIIQLHNENKELKNRIHVIESKLNEKGGFLNV